MLHMLMRQRRRFAFALLLTQIALFNVWPQLIIFAVMILGIFAGCILMVASSHPLRRLVECGSIGLLCATQLQTPELIGVTFASATGLAYVLLYSPLLDRIPYRIGMRSRKTFEVNLDQRTTWNKLIPGRGHPAAYWTGTMKTVHVDADDADTLYLTLQADGMPAEEITITYLEMTENTSAKYLVERDTLLAGEEIIMFYQLSSNGGERTTITSDMRVSGLPFRHAVERFFDDVLGDELDSFATMTACQRTWRLRRVTDIDLTSELGRDGVRLAVRFDDDDDEAAGAQRLSA